MTIDWITPKKGRPSSIAKDITITCPETEYGFIFSDNALSKVDPDRVGKILLGKSRNRIYFMPHESGYTFPKNSKRFSVSKSKIERFMCGQEMPTGEFELIYDNVERFYYIEY